MGRLTRAIAVKVVFPAAIEAIAITLLFPQLLPDNPLVWTLIRTLTFQISIYLFYLTIIWPTFITPLRHLPSPKDGLPFLNHFMALFRKPPGKDFLRWMNEIPNEGLITFYGVGNQPRVLLTNPKSLAEVLVQKSYLFKKPKPLRVFLRRILGDGLIIVEGEEHKFQRKHIMPVFGYRHLKELYPMMWKKSVALTQGVQAQIDSQQPSAGEKNKDSNVVEVNHWANKVTMDIIGVAGLGRDFNALRNSDDPLVENYEEILEPTVEKLSFFICQIILPPWFVNKLPWGLNERMRIITGNLGRICNELVAEKRVAIKQHSDQHKDILSVLINSNNFSDQQLTDQLLTFLAAGHETTSSAFTWTTHLLSTHPDIQTRLREEIRAHIPENPGSNFDLASTLEALPLLNAVCNETLRLYPTVPITIRDCCEDTTICGTPIARGTQLILCPWATNRLKSEWGENADEFVPERWIDSATGKPNNTGGTTSNYNLLTFLHGPRSCIGANFAKAEMRCLVAAFVLAFEMEVADPSFVAEPHGVITTKPWGGMNLRLRPVGSLKA